MDKFALEEKIKRMADLTNDEKSALVGLLRTQKKYGLVWEDKLEDVEERMRDELPLLTEVKERAIVSGDKDAPNHILIEGDNLEALTALCYTHSGKIDVIYIDPPYNTGNKDFIYNDRYVDREDSYRHSKWLSFMHKRLKIAKQLLSMGGVIFISIDNNEQAQLKLLCDEVFGQENHIATLPRITKKSGKNQQSTFADNHDYVVCYFKKSSSVEFTKRVASDADYPFIDEFYESRGGYKLNQTLDYDTLGYVNSLDYPIEIGGKTYYAGVVTQAEYEKRKKDNPKDGYRWRWSQEKFDFGYKNGFVVVKPKTGRLYTKTYFKATIEKINGNYQIEYVDRSIAPTTLDYIENIYSNDNAKKNIDNINLQSKFNYPKPISLVQSLVALFPNSRTTILDFFAGSGTTLHATMQLNAEDGGKRQCILVTNNENNICEEVTYERNKRVIQGYTTPKGEKVEGLKANNLRYYKTDYISRDRTSNNMRRLVSLATDLLCIKENLYEEKTVFGRLTTHKGIFRYFDDGKKKMLVVYREEAIEGLVDEIYNMDLSERMKVYVFSPSEDPWEDMFEDVEDKVELCALPLAVYNAYQRVLPKRRDKTLQPKEEKENNIPNELFGNL